MAKEKKDDPRDLSDQPVQKKKKKSKSRISNKEGGGSSKARPKFCPNSSKSFNLSKTFNRRHHVSTTALKQNNEQLAKSLNKCKVAIATFQTEKLVLERDNMDLRAENNSLRSHVDPNLIESEVQKRLVDILCPVKRHLNGAIDNMVGLSDNLTQSMQLVSAPLRMSQSQPTVGQPSRSSSIGANFRMRPVANFQMREGGSGGSSWGREGAGSGNSPPKQLSKVSPMVAGHAISRPRIQLTRMDIAAMSAAREQLDLEGGDQGEGSEAVEPSGSEGEHVEMIMEDTAEHQEDEYEEIEASPPHPGRNRFNLTNIGEESSMLEESRAEESILEESGAEEPEQVEAMEILQEEDSQEERDGGSPEQSFRRRSRSALPSRQSVSGQAVSRQSVGQTVTGRQSVGQAVSRQSVGQTVTGRQSVGGRQSLSAVSGSGSQTRQSVGKVGSVRQSLGQVFRQEGSTSTSTSDPTPPSQGRLSRPPLRDLTLPSPSPQVDILKTQRHIAVVLSDLVTMNHPALPSQYSHPSPHSTPLLPTPSPACKRTSASIIPVEEFPEDPSESFLEQMCDADPLEGPSWLFASVHKKKRRSGAVRKLSAVWSDSERASTMGSSGRATSSLDSSDIDMSSPGEGASSREVSGYVLDRDLLESAIVVATPDVSLDITSVEATLAKPVSSSSSSSSIAVNSVTTFEDDMELTRTVETVVVEKELNSSNQENNPLQLFNPDNIDESNLSISVSQTPRTPLSSLTYTDPSGEVVKFNPRTDTGVTVAGLREAHILLDNVGMVDSAGRSPTPYKLSECYIDLSPGRSMSLDQLFSLGLRAGISSPTANSPRATKRKYASEALVSRVTPPSKKSRVSDLPSMGQKGVRASLDMIPFNLNKDIVVKRAAMDSANRGNFLTKLPSVKVTRCTSDQETIANAASKPVNFEATGFCGLVQSIETCDEIPNSGETSQTDIAINLDKNKKKSVMPSFVLLEKSPAKTVSPVVENVIVNEDSAQVSSEALTSVASNETGDEVVIEDSDEVAVEANPSELPKEAEKARRKNRVDYAVVLKGDDDDESNKGNKSKKQAKKVAEPPSRNLSKAHTNNLKEADIMSLLSDEEVPSSSTADADVKEVAVSEHSMEVKKNKTSSRLSKAPKKLSKATKQKDKKPNEEEVEATPTVVSDDEPESVEPETQVIDTAVSEKPAEKPKKISRKASHAGSVPDPTESRKSSKPNDRTSEISAPSQAEESTSRPSLGVPSSSRGSSIGPSAETSESRGRSRRGGTQVSYKEAPLGKKLRQGDAGSTSVYSDFKAEKKEKVRKSGKKK